VYVRELLGHTPALRQPGINKVLIMDTGKKVFVNAGIDLPGLYERLHS
jgi:hypothetical protein